MPARRCAPIRGRCIALAVALSAAAALAGCAGPTIAPQRGIVSLAAPTDPGQAPDAPQESRAPTGQDGQEVPAADDTPLCWAMLQDLSIMDDSGLDPTRAAFFVAWGRHMKDVDRCLSITVPV